MISAQDELERFLDRKGAVFADALLNLPVAKMHGSQAHTKALWDLAGLIKHTLQLTDMHGRKRTLLEADHVSSTARFSAIPENANPVSALPFDEAIDDMVTREPRLAESWQEVSRIYTDEHAFAMARSADMKVTERVQKEVQTLIEGGKSSAEVENAILEIGKSAEMGAVRDWDRAYASNIFQTNASTGYSNGRFEQAQDPDVREVIPAFEYAALHDDRTREWHMAADGLIADTLDGVWATFKPPIGWRCRCSPNFISIFELERRGLLQGGRVVRYEPPNFKNAHPDPGFRTGRFQF